MIPKFVAAFVLMCVSAAAAAGPLLPNGVRGLTLGMTGAETEATVKTLWPTRHWSCKPWFAADVENCWGFATSEVDITYGGHRVYAARLVFERGVLVQVQLEFGTSIAAQAYKELSLLLRDVTLLVPENISNEKFVRKYWHGETDLIMLTNDVSSTSLFYVTVPFQMRFGRADTSRVQRDKGM